VSACVKCGNSGDGNIWQSTAGFGSSPSHIRLYCRGGAKCNVDPQLAAGKEHLDCECKGCGYTWAEPCKDAKP